MTIMERLSKVMLLMIVFTLFSFNAYAENENEDKTIRREREYIKAGNKLYEQKRYAEAEVQYLKAVEANPNSMLGRYNLGLSLLQQATDEKADSLKAGAYTHFDNVAKGTVNPMLSSKAFYNMGNIMFGKEQYGESIELYKQSLRLNPDDDEARTNLRIAQLKKQEQDKNKNDNKDQNGQDNKEEQDKKEDKQEQNDNQQDKQKQQQQKPQQNLSKENAEQILQAMQNQEKKTQEKVNKQKARVVRSGNQW